MKAGTPMLNRPAPPHENPFRRCSFLPQARLSRTASRTDEYGRVAQHSVARPIAPYGLLPYTTKLCGVW